jgi:hypothetical protein
MKPKKYKGYDYIVMLQQGGYLTAYVRIPEDHKFYGKNYNELMDEIDCHGGLTFSTDVKTDNDKRFPKGYWIGWDYAHLGDFHPVLGHFTKTIKDRWDEEKHWQPFEVEGDCKEVIRQLLTK